MECTDAELPSPLSPATSSTRRYPFLAQLIIKPEPWVQALGLRGGAYLIGSKMTLHAPLHPLHRRQSCVPSGRRGKEKRMITVTDEAKDHFLNVEHPEGTVLRLDPVVDQDTGETQIGISAGEPMSGDQVVERDGEAVLHIAGLVSQALDGSTL